MNQIKIGEFISSQRKSKGLTQASLAERLGITDRAVSKWECGKGLPDASIMLELCEILGITVNELLCGEKIEMENKNEKNEQLLIDMAKEADAIECAVNRALDNGYRTADIWKEGMKKVGCKEMGAAIAARL